MSEVKNLPEKKYRAGPISLTVWSNQGEKGSYNTIQLTRAYKDSSDKWQNANSLRVGDIPKAMVLLGKAYEYLLCKEQEDYAEEKMF